MRTARCRREVSAIERGAPAAEAEVRRDAAEAEATSLSQAKSHLQSDLHSTQQEHAASLSRVAGLEATEVQQAVNRSPPLQMFVYTVE